ncbi:GNAT family N-acetyltransferase [Enterococcus sp. LJL99]
MSNNLKRQKDTIDFRLAQKEELPFVINLFAESFKNDPLINFFNPTGKNQPKFVHDLFSVNTISYFRKHLCFVATIQNQIVAAALVKKKAAGEVDFLDYTLAGGWKLINDLGLRSFLKFMQIYEKAQEACKKLGSDVWYVDTLAVSKQRQGEGIGGRVLQECVLSYIKKHGGGTVALMTQNRNNLKFYSSNGFANFSNDTLTNEDDTIENFSFKQQIN